MKCQIKQCFEVATHHARICVPTTIAGDPPITATLSLVLCPQCAKNFDTASFLDCPTPSGNGTNRNIFNIIGKRGNPLDFSKIFVQAVRIGEEESKMFKANPHQKPDTIDVIMSLPKNGSDKPVSAQG